MNAVNPLLPLFKGQLEAECSALAQKFGLTIRGHHLLYWYFTWLHNFTEQEVTEILCDGGNDLGIDALWIDDESVVHFISSSIQKGRIIPARVKTDSFRGFQTG